MARKSTQSPTMATSVRGATRQIGARGRQRPSAPAAKQSAIDPVPAVIERARDMGLLTASTQNLGARLPTKLVEQAKKRTGIASTTDLLIFALANVSLEDNFAATFVAARGTLDPDLDVGF